MKLWSSRSPSRKKGKNTRGSPQSLESEERARKIPPTMTDFTHFNIMRDGIQTKILVQRERVERHLIEEASLGKCNRFLIFETINFYKHNVARAILSNMIKTMNKLRKSRNPVPQNKKFKGNNQKDAIVIEIIDDQAINIQTIEPLNQSLKDYQPVMEIQTKQEKCVYPWQDGTGLRVARINHFFKKDGDIWFEVMMGRAETIYREPQLMNFAFLSDKYSLQLYTYLLNYFQSHAYGQV